MVLVNLDLVCCSLPSFLVSCHKFQSKPFLSFISLFITSFVHSTAIVRNMHNLPTTQIPLIIVDTDFLIINDNEEINNNKDNLNE